MNPTRLLTDRDSCLRFIIFKILMINFSNFECTEIIIFINGTAHCRHWSLQSVVLFRSFVLVLCLFIYSIPFVLFPSPPTRISILKHLMYYFLFVCMCFWMLSFWALVKIVSINFIWLTFHSVLKFANSVLCLFVCLH